MRVRGLIKDMWRTIACLVGLGTAVSGLSQQIVVSPYVQLGNDDQSTARKSITILWHGSAPGAWSFRANGATKTVHDDPVRAGGIAPHEILSARVSNLSPGQKVSYEVLLGGKVVATGHTFAPIDGTIDVAVLGDCGRNSKGQRKVAKWIESQKPDLALVVGDIVYPNGRMTEYRTNFYAIMSPLMRDTLTVAATGNHDTAYRNLKKYPDGLGFYPYWRQPLNGPAIEIPVTGDAAALDAASAGVRDRRANFMFDDGPVHWVVLDSNTYVNWKRKDLRAWLDKALSASNKPWNIVAFHHVPYHSSKKHASDTFMRSIGDMLNKHKVDLVLAGHVHNYQRTYPLRSLDEIDRRFDGVRNTHPRGPIYICTGAGGGELYDQPLADDAAVWKPFTAAYKSGFGATFLQISAHKLILRHLDSNGIEQDRIRIDK